MVLFFGNCVGLVVVVRVGFVESFSLLVLDVDGPIDSEGLEVSFVVVLLSVSVVVWFVSLGSFVVVVVLVGTLVCVVLGSRGVVGFVGVLLRWF